MNPTREDRPLPEAFRDLQEFVAIWALPTERERHRARLDAELAEIHRFYDAMFPRMGAVMDHLRGFPADGLDTLPPETAALFDLAKGFMEASHPVDLRWRRPDIDDAFPVERITYNPPSSVF